MIGKSPVKHILTEYGGSTEMKQISQTAENNQVKVWNEPIAAKQIDEWVKDVQANIPDTTTALVVYLQHGPKPYAAKIAVQIGCGMDSQNFELARFMKVKDAISTFASYALTVGADVNLRDSEGNIFKSILQKPTKG